MRYVLQCVTVCCSVLQCVVVCCREYIVNVSDIVLSYVTKNCSWVRSWDRSTHEQNFVRGCFYHWRAAADLVCGCCIATQDVTKHAKHTGDGNSYV